MSNFVLNIDSKYKIKRVKVLDFKILCCNLPIVPHTLKFFLKKFSHIPMTQFSLETILNGVKPCCNLQEILVTFVSIQGKIGNIMNYW